MHKKRLLISCLVLILTAKTLQAAEYTLAIQPILPPDKIKQIYKPLASYLSEKTGQTIKLSTFRSFRSYWSNMKRLKGFDMVLDGPHFIDYRIKKNSYKVLVKQPDTVSFTVVTKDDIFVFDVEELAQYRVASMVAPGLGGLRLKELFKGAEKKPTIISSFDADDCIKLIRDGKADAAIIPTPMVGRYENLNVVLTTEPTPHIGFSVSPEIPPAVVSNIKKALLEAPNTEEGRKMLSDARLATFVATDNETYDGYGKLLQIMKK